MIIYYDPETNNMLGMSYVVDQNRGQSYFETDDPIAEKIFLGQEKISKYCIKVSPGAVKNGQLVLRSSSVNAADAKGKITEIKQGTGLSEAIIIQDISTKTVSIKIAEEALAWWQSDPYYSKKSFSLVACKKGDPYIPYWYKTISHTDDVSNLIVNYTCSDDITFYAPAIFGSYHYEIKSS